MFALTLLLVVPAVLGAPRAHVHNQGHHHSCVHTNKQQLQEGQVVSMVLADMDKDGDGIAAAADITNEFLTRYDHDGSGHVSEDEFVKQWHNTYHDVPDFAGYLFHHFDVDDDGELTLGDLAALAKTVDTDGNGQTSEAEFTKYLMKLYTDCVPSHTD